MKLFKRWRRSRSAEVAPEPAQAAAPEPTSPPQQAPPRGKPRARRPSTMGKTLAEQAYLAEAAMRVKNNPPPKQ